MGFTPHTACHPGKRVRVKLRDGEEFVDRFIDRTDKWVFFSSGRKVPKRDIKSFVIWKNK